MLKGKTQCHCPAPERVRKGVNLKKVGTGTRRGSWRLPSSNRFHTAAARPTGVEIAHTPLRVTWKGLSLLVTGDQSRVLGASACHDGAVQRGGSWAWTALPLWHPTSGPAFIVLI